MCEQDTESAAHRADVPNDSMLMFLIQQDV